MTTDGRQAASAEQQAASAGQQEGSAGQQAGVSHRPRHAKPQLLEDQVPAQGGPQPGGQTQALAQAQPASRRLASHPVVGFIPWILFWVIGSSATWETGTIAALIAAVLVAALSMDLQPLVAWSTPAASGQVRPPFRLDLRRLKLLDVATVLFFAALVLAAIFTSRHDVTELDRYSQAISSGALGLIALGSIVFRHPFTVDYAKEEAPPAVWHTAVFKRINLVLTATWAAVFLVCAGLGLLAQQDVAKGLRDWLNWYLPIALIFVAYRFTVWYPEQVKSLPGKKASDA
jgi:hypothetical protein